MRFRPDFKIHDLFWAVTLAVMAFGWGFDHWVHSPGVREAQLEGQVSSLRQALSWKHENIMRTIQRLHDEVRTLKDSSGDQMPIVASRYEL
jgi:hypothetical protein